MNYIYKATGLQKFYDGRLVLNIPFFSLQKGSSLVLLGPNGSGKSTFLRMLAFLEKPDSGSLEYLYKGEGRQNCTLLLQEPWLMRASVFHNVVLGLKLRGVHKNLDEKFQNVMIATGFKNPSSFAKRKPHTLSGGEKQRIALASRLILQPAVLLLDEPTAYIDQASADSILAALHKEQKKGLTVVCATHDLWFCRKMQAKIMKMSDLSFIG